VKYYFENRKRKMKKSRKVGNFLKNKWSIDSTELELQLSIDEIGGFSVQVLFELQSAEPVVGLLDHKSPRITELRQTQGEIGHSNQRRP